MSEVRLIDANELKKKFKERGYWTYTQEYGDAIPVGWIISGIDNAPTVVENGLIAEDYIREKMFFINRESDNQPIAVISVSDLVAFERPQVDCENCDFRKFSEKFVDGVVELMNENGITSLKQLNEMLRGSEV